MAKYKMLDAMKPGRTKTAVTEPSKARIIFTLALDVLLLLIVISPMVVIYSSGIQPFKRGFFCDDDSLTYPFKPYDEDIVSPTMLLLMTLPVPILVIIAIEMKVFWMKQRKRTDQDCGVTPCRKLFATMYTYVGVYLFGYMCTMSVTVIIKYFMGRLRPYFLNVCKPDMTGINCTDVNGLHLYITEDICTGNLSDITEARMSHPSGHASSAMFAAVFTTVFLQMRFFFPICRLLKPLLQTLLLMLGVMCCLSRVIDFKHHVTDVLSGGTLGTFIAIVAMILVSAAQNPEAWNLLTSRSRFGDAENSNEYWRVPGDDSPPNSAQKPGSIQEQG